MQRNSLDVNIRIETRHDVEVIFWRESGCFVLLVLFRAVLFVVFYCFCTQNGALSNIFQFLTLLTTSWPLFVFLPCISGKRIMHKT